MFNAFIQIRLIFEKYVGIYPKPSVTAATLLHSSVTNYLDQQINFATPRMKVEVMGMSEHFQSLELQDL